MTSAVPTVLVSFAITELLHVEEKLQWFLWFWTVTILHASEWKQGLETSQKSCYWNTMCPKMINNGKITSERLGAEMHPHSYPHESLNFDFNKIQLKPNEWIAVKTWKNEFERPRVTSERNRIYMAETADSSFQEPRWILKIKPYSFGFLN